MKEGWEYKTFKDQFSINMGKTPPRGDSSSWDKSKNTNNKWVSIADISLNEGKIIFDTKEYISDKAAEKIKKVKAGSLLMSFKLTIGKMAFAGDDLFTNEAIIAIPQNEDYDLHFLYYYLLQYDWRTLTEGNEKVKGATLNKQSIGKIQLPIISIDEQRRIVSYLDSSFKLIDEIKDKVLKSLTEAKALFQSALAEAMEPKEGWEEKTLKEIGLTQTGTTPSKSNKAYYGNYIPFIRPSEINIDGLGTIEYNSEIMLSQKGIEAGRKFTKKSILMVCIGATIGKVGYSERDISCNQQINVLSPYNGYNYKYLYYAMSSSVFQKKVIMEGTSAQATLPIINKGKWEKFLLYIPPLPTQKQIVSHLDKLSSKVRAIEEKYQKMVEECDALKQAMLRDVFE